MIKHQYVSCYYNLLKTKLEDSAELKINLFIMLEQLVQLLTFQELVILFSLITFIVKILNRLKRNRGSVKTVTQAKTTLRE